MACRKEVVCFSTVNPRGKKVVISSAVVKFAGRTRAGGVQSVWEEGES